MLEKNQFFIYLSLLLPLAILCMPTPSFSAKIPTDNIEYKEQAPNKHSQPSKKKQLPLYQLADYSNQPQPPPFSQVQQYNPLQDIGKKIILKYQDSKLIQDSLESYASLKYHFKQADNLANDFVFETITALNLDTLLYNGSYLSPSLQANNKDQRRLSLYKIQHRESDIYTEDTLYSDTFFLTKLLKFHNLLYLLALFVLYVLIKWALKLLLFAKQQNTMNKGKR